MKSSFKRSSKTSHWVTICILTVSVVGFISSMQSHAMAPAYTITDLGTLGGSPNQSHGYGINNCGTTVGDSVYSGGLAHPFYKKGATMTDVGTLGTDGTAYAVNSTGYAIGYSNASSGPHAFIWHDDNNDGVSNPGELQDIGVVTGDDIATAYGINDSNQVVGISGNNANFTERAFLWQNGVMQQIPGTAAIAPSRAVSINNAGTIAGWAVVSLPPSAPTHAFVLKNNIYIDLGTLDNTTLSLLSFALRISADGHVVGYSQISSNGTPPFHPFLWFDANSNNTSDAGEMKDLGTLPGDTHGYAYDINASGYVVGTSQVHDDVHNAFVNRAFVWHDDNGNGVNDPGEMKDLNTQFSDAAWTTLVEARSINDGGQIVGWGTKSNGETHAFLLTPAGFTPPPCPGSSPSPSPTPATTTLISVQGSGTYGGTATLSATLYSNDMPVSGKTISFTLNSTAVCGSSTGIPCPATNGSGIASLSGVSLAGINAGNYPNAVGASFAGDSSYASTNQTGSLTVDKVSLTVTADNKSKTYRAPNPTLTFTPTGFVNGETSAVLTGAPSLNTTATTTSSVGGYPITISQGTLNATNYSFSFVSGTLTVNKATPVINWNNPSDITYGMTLGSTQLNATATNPNDNSIVAGSFTYNPASATVLHAANGQTLRADFAPTDTLDYNTPAQKTVSINVLKALLTITADNKVKLVNDANPPLTFTPSGFVNGDTSSVLTGAPSITTTATQSSPVGNYPITITQGTLAAADYSFTFVNGTLTVTEAAPVILLETGTNNAAAVDSVTFVRGPFSVTDNHNFSGDHLTRIIIFTTPLANPDLTLKVFASSHQLVVESFGSVTGVAGLSASYIVVKLDPILIGSGPINHDLTVSLREVTSNTATLTIIP